MGSNAYGTSQDDSDVDIYGICLPPIGSIFPHTVGEIPGFGTQTEKFNVWQQHHVMHDSVEYDFTVYNIVKFFALAMDNNSNIIDSLFVPRNCIIHSTAIGERIRENRRLFLHKGAWHRFRGYAYAQMHKIDTRQNSSNPKRQASIDAFGYDVKFGVHLIRLILEVEQILIEGDIDLQRHNNLLKVIRRGEWSLEYLKEWFASKEKSLEQVYTDSTLRYKPDEDLIKTLLLECIEMHYGSVDSLISKPDQNASLLRELQTLVERYT
jgi:predicted nucleotidyltransferase